MDCVDPPLNAAPPGDWRCPLCVVLPDGDCDGTDNATPTDPPTLREQSVASTSRSCATAPPAPVPPARVRQRVRKSNAGKTRPRAVPAAVPSDGSDADDPPPV